jgi:hypothetical protein
MSELDEDWAAAMAEAEQRARAGGRGDIVEYLTLRASNDLARKVGIQWLLETFSSHAGEANRAGASIRIEKADAHRFRVGNSTMVGTLLTFRLGVRSLMVEAGWPRTPRDGIVRGGGLAHAHIRHFGNRKADEDLLLVQTQSGPPQWFIIENEGTRSELLESRIRQHLNRLMGDKG